MKKSGRNENQLSRRQFIGSSLTLATGIALGRQSAFGTPALLRKSDMPDSMIRGVQIGVITYSYRDMPDQSAEAMLKDIVDSGISACELMGDPAEQYAGKPVNSVDMRTFYPLMRKAHNKETLTDDEKKQLDDMHKKMDAYHKSVADWRASVSMDKFVQLGKMFKDAGVKIYAWKPDAFGKNNTDAEIDYAFNVAKVLGANQCTTEHPGDDAQTKKLGEFAAKHKIYMAYHGHLQSTPTLWDTALKQSPYNAINMDFGHFVAAGNQHPLEFVKEKHERIKSIHLKDRKNKEDGQANMPWGQGDTPLTPLLQLMRDQKYTFPGTVELEYDIHQGSDAVKEVMKCLQYCKKALNG